MRNQPRIVVVFGATGQQGGATARALLADGWRVRALARNPLSATARALASSGVEVVRGDFRDASSVEQALSGAYGVFSVQPSSGQPEYGVTDQDEERYGKSVADAARRAGIEHFVYSSLADLSGNTGVGHFESKWRIEEHVRALGIPATVLRPAAFMELLAQPHFGLAQGTLQFFTGPDQAMQFIAVEDIGHLAARVFAEPARHLGKAFDIAGDELTGAELAAKLTLALGRPIEYSLFPAEFLEQSAMMRRIVELVAQGRFLGHADIGELRRLHPGLLGFDAWLERSGTALLQASVQRAASSSGSS